jgi:uncharacterized protein
VGVAHPGGQLARHDPARAGPLPCLPAGPARRRLRRRARPDAPFSPPWACSGRARCTISAAPPMRSSAPAPTGPSFDAVFDAVFLGRALCSPGRGATPEDLPRPMMMPGFDLMPEADEEEPSGAEATAAERLFARRSPRRRGARPAPLPARCPRAAAPPVAPHAAGKGRLRRSAPRLSRDDAQGRRDHPPAHPPPPAAPAPGADADRRLGQHEGGHRGRAAARPCAGAAGRAGRGVHPRHAPDPRHPRAAPPRPGSGAGAGLGAGRRLGWRHAAGRGAGGVSVVPRFASFARGALVSSLSDGLERGGPEALVAAMARMRGWRGPRACGCRRSPPIPAFRPRPAPCRPSCRCSTGWATAATPPAIAREILTFAKGARRVIDSHFHVWRQADLPWLTGPMQPRIFGPYEPIRRDYPMAEYLADIAGQGIEGGLCPGQLAARARPRRGRVDRGDALRPAGRMRRRLCRHDRARRPPGAGPAGALPAPARHPPAVSLAREPAIPLRRPPDLCRPIRGAAQHRRLADYGWSFDLQVFAGQMESACDCSMPARA